MKYHETCPTCGHQLTAYKHRLNKSQVNALMQLVLWYRKTGKPCNLQKHLTLTKNQYNNFQKLQYFQAVTRTTKGWFPTNKGIDFIEGRGYLWNRCATIESKLINELDHPVWQNAKRPVMVRVWDIDETAYKKREEYQTEKSNQMSLL